MSVKERLIKFIDHKKISIRRFEREAGLSYSYVNNIRVSIQPDKIDSIAKGFPELNIGWLLTGEGEMLRKGDTGKEKIAGKESESGSKGVSEPTPEYGSRRGGEVSIPREILELLNMQAETIRSQQRTIEKLEAENKKINAQPEGNAGFAGVG